MLLLSISPTIRTIIRRVTDDAFLFNVFNGIFFFFFQAYLSFSLSEINHGFLRFSLCFARGIRKIHRSVFIETREGGSPFHPRQKVSSFLVLRREEGERGERRKFEGRGRGKTRVQPRPTFFQRGARERRERLLPFHLAPLSPTPARIRSWKFGSSRDSTTRP